ncbi:MAG: 2-dehydropantoate 2-reductase [Rhodospirillales bacterium]|jgi:2-dehydropantoate 2-reductase|nr:2-dehydropantoate 2-reductase [Rhodospirillaceae bacterium]MDP6426511.1 2-dehydropantoate 2-reductase [Rhodospirillales bacterium]MDP6645230.1 2-dehydropantoate 2-reductase [Rhodospirillales bacterium]MDP6840409.1 2-dehydropantoate 2-reductase [Rhodospirillales bacterium]|tara:strand:+ start:137 stop:1117 length:981 start_codon:yes stop_codon:yes gene_type:complete
MNICIYGAGAIGGFLGAELALAGADVSLIARGPHLAAMQANGLQLIRDGETRTAHPKCFENPADAGVQDYVIVTLKAHSVPAIVAAMQPLLGPKTAVVWAVNGVPWWYFHGLGGAYRDLRLESVDPGGVQWSGIGPERIIASVVYPAAEVVEPGVVRHAEGDRFSLGEPGGEKTERIQELAAILIGAGLRAPIRPRIRDEIWVKLWGNLSFNPISALTGATLEQMCSAPDSRALIRRMMLEAQVMAEKIGVKFAVDVDKRIDGGMAVGAHKTSMLQDLERRRPMEIDALVGAVSEMGRLTETPTPTIDAVLALVTLRARLAGCYPE